MIELFQEEAFNITGDLAIGAAFWLLALALPFRALASKAEIRWDVIGYIGSMASAIAIVRGIEAPLLDWTDSAFGAWYGAYGHLPWWVALLVYIVVADFGVYWAHRLLHSRRLWDAHAWHHSPSYLYFLSGTRAAPLHIVVLIAPYTLAYVLLPYPEFESVALAHAAFGVANQHYIHSNLRFPFARRLEYVFVTPRMHFVHHSRMRARSDSNYGSIFSIWDRLFGTYTDPERVPADDALGLNYEISPRRAFLGLPPRRADASRAPTPVRGE